MNRENSQNTSIMHLQKGILDALLFKGKRQSSFSLKKIVNNNPFVRVPSIKKIGSSTTMNKSYINQNNMNETKNEIKPKFNSTFDLKRQLLTIRGMEAQLQSIMSNKPLKKFKPIKLDEIHRLECQKAQSNSELILKKNEENLITKFKILLSNRKWFLLFTEFCCINDLLNIQTIFKKSTYFLNILIIKNQIYLHVLNGHIENDERVKFWREEAKVYYLFKRNAFSYHKLLNQKCKYEDIIIEDIKRTYSYIKKNESHQNMLFNVLKAYSNSSGDIGYCQGMSFIVYLLLLILNNEKAAFWLFQKIMNNYNLKNLYEPGMPKLKEMCSMIDCFTEIYLPRIRALFKKNHLNCDYCASNWLLTLFTYDMTPRISIKILDFFLVKRWSFIAGMVLSIFTLYDCNVKIFDENSIQKICKFARGPMDEAQLFELAMKFSNKSEVKKFGIFTENIKHNSNVDFVSKRN